MREFLVIFFFCTSCTVGFSQWNSFPFGKTTYSELDLKQYDADTAAVALVLQEFGEAYFDNDNDHNLIFEYHVRIKILKPEGLSYGTFEIPLRKSHVASEKIRTVKASSFSIENGSMRETKLDYRQVYLQNENAQYNTQKFAVPNVKVGCVVEVYYSLESPFFYNFRTWEFQTDIPKLESEFWSIIPANYEYNISLRGFLPLASQESEVVDECFTPGSRRVACTRLKYRMQDVPAFKEEEFMTAKSNFLAAIYFELAQVNHFDGRKDRITKEWKNVATELRQNSSFGVQLKRGKDVVDEQVRQLISGTPDTLERAQAIYDFIKDWYAWNGVYGMFSASGIKKAFDTKTGNVGDINLSLIAGLKEAGIRVEPVLLSTRENGLATELYPVLSDYNYVIAKVTIKNKIYLLDATDDFHPFGLLPERCLNGQGRVIGEKESYWLELKPRERGRMTAIINLTLVDNHFAGTIHYVYSGYEAVAKREEIFRVADEKQFVRDLTKDFPGIKVEKFEIKNLENLSKSLEVKLNVQIEQDAAFNESDFMLNPFFVERWKQNPFRAAERLYPVDFGAPMEETIVLNLHYPEVFELDYIPEKVGLKLPENGGHFLFEISNTANRLSMNSTLLVTKPVFTANEYYYLKELFNHVVATQQTELVFKKKK